MSTTVIQKTWDVDGVLTDVSAMTIEVKRSDTEAVVVSTTPMTKVSTGTYEISINDPDPGLTYQWTLSVTHDGHTDTFTGTELGGSDTTLTTSLYDLKHLIIPDVGGVSEALLEQMIRRVFADFCRETGIWSEDLNITTVADQAIYTIPIVTGGVVTAITKAVYAENDAPVSISVSRDTKTITLDSVPSESGLVITITAKIMPAPSCETSPTAIIDQYGYGIASGVTARLKAQINKPWTDFKTIELFSGEYEAARSRANMDIVTARLGTCRIIPRCF